MPKLKAPRYAGFDISKAIAMYLVVYAHLLDQVAGKPTTLLSFCHLPVFFLISGYLLFTSLERHSAGDVFVRKVRTLVIPFLLWSGVSFCANAFVNRAQGMEFFKSEFLNIFLYARSVWFLISLFLASVMLIVADIIAKKTKAFLMLPVSVAMWALLSFLAPNDILCFYKVKWLFPFLLLGYYIAKHSDRLKAVFKRGAVIGGGIACCVLYPVLALTLYTDDAFMQYSCFEYRDASGVGMGILFYIISLLGTGLVMFLADFLTHTPLSKPLSEVGKYSVDIYVIHMLLIKFVIWKPEFLTSRDILFSYIYLPVYGAIIVAIVWVMSRFILHKIPLYRMLMGIKAPAKKTAVTASDSADGEKKPEPVGTSYRKD